jgi:hypothetical protein
MLLELYNLLRKSSTGRVPLEDFTTECFAGLLDQHPLVMNSFTEWLELPNGDFKTVTQKSYPLEDDVGCIIDLVLESENTICFIEHKVNSKEGWEQLNRYTKVLEKYTKKQTFLKYCTKHHEHKPHELHGFSQYRWLELASWLQNTHSDIALVSDFLTFLKHHQMTLDTSISPETVITLNKFMQTYDAMDFHVHNALPSFKKYFPKSNIEKQENISKIRYHDRIARLTSRIVEDHSKHSELLYCIHFGEVKLQTQIWISISHPLAEVLYQKVIDSNVFKYWKDNNGVGIYLDCKLYQFIETSDSNDQIKEWFTQSFLKFRNFVDSNPEIAWSNNIL